MKWLDWASGDKRLKLYWFSILVVALGALAVRAPRLSLRPMHTDEAVHADNFRKAFLEHGGYKYDPNEYHGPTLNYFTLIPAWLSSAHTYADITEVTLRIVPVVFGTLVVLLTLLLVRGLGTCRRGGGAAGGPLAGDGLLQPLLHPGDAAGLLHLRRHRLRLPLCADPDAGRGRSRRGYSSD